MIYNNKNKIKMEGIDLPAVAGTVGVNRSQQYLHLAYEDGRGDENRQIDR